MKKIKELFRLRYQSGLSQREIARCVGCGRTTVHDYIKRAQQAGLDSYEKIEVLSEDSLLTKLNLQTSQSKCFWSSPLRKESSLPDWNYIYSELSKKHVTLSLLWEEYQEDHPKGYSYSQFCVHYRRWRQQLSVVMRQEHKAGEKAFIDYAGTTVDILISPKTGEVRSAQIFVAVLGASSYTYAEATWSQGICDWVMSHRRMFEYFDGVPQILVPDNLKSGVIKPDRYEAKVNRSYQDLAEHYGTCVIPARVRKPQDKAKAEVGVLLVSRWIIAALRNKVFHSLEELNGDIQVLLEKINDKKMRHFKKSRRELFEEIDRPALSQLRSQPYMFSEWKQARVNIDYHIVFDDHFYSVPYQLIKKEVSVRATSQVIEIFHQSQRVASHHRSYKKGGFNTDPGHRPESHKAHLKWTPERIISWAKQKGNNIGLFVEYLITSQPHPEQAYRSALGVIRLADKYGEKRLDQACHNAIAIGSIRYQTVKNMLKNKMDQVVQGSDKQEQQDFFSSNSNVRGKEYYH